VCFSNDILTAIVSKRVMPFEKDAILCMKIQGTRFLEHGKRQAKKGSTSQARFLLRKRNNERQPLDSFKRTDKRFNWINCQSIKKNRDMTRWPFLRKGSFVLSAIGGRPHE